MSFILISVFTSNISTFFINQQLSDQHDENQSRNIKYFNYMKKIQEKFERISEL